MCILQNAKILCGSKSAQVAYGLRKEQIFGIVLFYDFANRVGSQNKSCFGLPVRARSYFALWTDSCVLSNSRKQNNHAKTCAPFQ